jgi:hypothetical protein
MRHHPILVICLTMLVASAAIQPAYASRHYPASSPSTPLRSPIPQTQQPPEIYQDQWELDTVLDWQDGFVENVLVTNNDGGELRLDADLLEGRFITRPYTTTFDLNAIGAFWRAELPEDTDMLLEVRGRSSTPALYLKNYTDADGEPGWTAWQPLITADARSRSDDGAFATANVLAFPSDTRYLQLRVSFTSEVLNASPLLNEITIAYLNTVQGPPQAAGLPRTPIIFGEDTLTPRPQHISRATWSAQRIAAQPNYHTPMGIMLYQLDILPGVEKPLPFLRALVAYQTKVLGWDDLAYHYLIDEDGNLYEGRIGGPTSTIPRLSGGDNAIHIAFIGNLQAAPSEPAQQTLTHLLSWLCQAYDIPAIGHHPVVVGDEYISRDNITAHRLIVPEAPDPSQAWIDLLPSLREQADTMTTRARWYFPEGNVRDYVQNLTFLNMGTTAANVGLSLMYAGATTPLVHDLTVPGQGHSIIQVNDIISGTASLSAIVAANQPIIAERSMQLSSDINVNTGTPQLSRIWYFPEGSTDKPFLTYLVLFNPHTVDTEAIITYMKGDGNQAEQRVMIRAQQRLVVTVNDVLPGVGFGTRVIASRPIAAERTMRFGPGESGVHMGPGITELSRWWFFAEGTTDPPFVMRLLVLNPHPQPSHTTITFMTPDGTSLKRNYAIPPTTRLVVDVNEVVPTLGIATIVESDRPVAAERALYFDARQLETEVVTTPAPTTTPLTDTVATTPTETTSLTTSLLMATNAAPMAGMVSFGATQPSYTWYFAHGTTSNANQYLLLGNPSRSQAQVTIECVLDDGSRETQRIVMPSESRYTFAVHDYYPDQPVISCKVQSTQRIVAERSIYTTGEWHGGSTSSGIPGE